MRSPPLPVDPMSSAEYQAEVEASRARRAARGEDSASMIEQAREQLEREMARTSEPCERSQTVRQGRRAKGLAVTHGDADA